MQTEIVIGDLKDPHNPERQVVKILCFSLGDVGGSGYGFIHSLIKYLLRAYCVPGTALNSVKTVVKQTQFPNLRSLSSSERVNY